MRVLPVGQTPVFRVRATDARGISTETTVNQSTGGYTLTLAAGLYQIRLVSTVNFISQPSAYLVRLQGTTYQWRGYNFTARLQSRTSARVRRALRNQG